MNLSVRPEMIDATLRTWPVNPSTEPPSPNDDRTVAIGLTDIAGLCFADETDRPVDSALIQGATASSLLTPPLVRQLLGTWCFDFRPLLAELTEVEREHIMALTPQADRVLYSEALNGFWDASRIPNVRIPREGHCYHVRSAEVFNEQIANFAS